jgi:hypothetical protein
MLCYLWFIVIVSSIPVSRHVGEHGIEQIHRESLKLLFQAYDDGIAYPCRRYTRVNYYYGGKR